MANYGINIIDSGTGQFTFTILRNPTTAASGGTNLNTNTFTQSAATGVVSAASGFAVSDTATGDGLGHVQVTPGEALNRCGELIRNDRAFNS